MKAEVNQVVTLTTTPKELIALANEWQSQIESNNYAESGSTLYKTIDNIQIKLRIDGQRYTRETDKIIVRKLD